MSEFTEQEMAQEVLDALLALKEDGPLSAAVGICNNIADLLDPYFSDNKLVNYWEDRRESAFENWDDVAASGDTCFPINGSYNVSPQKMWVGGEYAAARWRLVDHLILHFQHIARGNPYA